LYIFYLIVSILAHVEWKGSLVFENSPNKDIVPEYAAHLERSMDLSARVGDQCAQQISSAVPGRGFRQRLNPFSLREFAGINRAAA
jgi:hypothetical protein